MSSDREAPPETKGKRGFASMSPEARRLICSMGGKAVPKEKRSFSKDNELAKRAGAKGGQNGPREKRFVPPESMIRKHADKVRKVQAALRKLNGS